jgi:hypothetical protein
VIADLVGKGKHIRTVPVPLWVKRAVDEWTGAAAITCGTIFRRVSRLDKIRFGLDGYLHFSSWLQADLLTILVS